MRVPVLAALAVLVCFTEASSAASPAAARVAIDVGHFKEKPGATSARGRPEFEFNNALSSQIASALTLRSTLVGADGSMARLSARVRAARGADLLLSVHHDSVQPHYLASWEHDGVRQRFSDRFAGFSLFVSRRNPNLARSLACASAIGASLRAAGFTPSLYHAEAIAGEMKRFADRANGVHYYDNLVVLATASSPAVLFEAGVIVNREEETALSDPARRGRMARAVAAGVESCLNVHAKPARL